MLDKRMPSDMLLLSLTHSRQYIFVSRQHRLSVYELSAVSGNSSRQGEIHRVQIEDLCDGCISLSNAEGL